VFGVWLKSFSPFTALRTFLLHGSIVNEVPAGFNSKNCKIDGPDFCKTFALNPGVPGIKLSQDTERFQASSWMHEPESFVGVPPWRDRDRRGWKPLPQELSSFSGRTGAVRREALDIEHQARTI
jgi:hypothetical protein